MAMDSGKGQKQEPEGEGGNSPHRPRQAKHPPPPGSCGHSEGSLGDPVESSQQEPALS